MTQPVTQPGREPSGAHGPPRVFLHLGCPKTGTTFLQAMLHQHRDRLERDGVFYPPGRRGAHHDAARDLRNVRRGGYLDPKVPGAWDRLVDDIHGWTGDGVAIVSSELLAFATEEQAARALSSLRPADVHLVLTLRDLVRQVPAVWQETVKNGNRMRYEEFLRHLERDELGPGPRGFWNGQDPDGILCRWAAGTIPADRVHLVTVPPAGAERNLLWTRFAAVLGLDPDAYAAVSAGANISLGMAETEVVRRLNEQYADAPWPFYARHIKHGIAQGVVAGRPAGTDRLVLPGSMLPWVQRRSEQLIASLSGHGYDVVGDLADLRPPADVSGEGAITQPDPQRLAEATAAAAEYFRTRELPASWRAPRGPGRRAIDVLRRGYRRARRTVRR